MKQTYMMSSDPSHLLFFCPSVRTLILPWVNRIAVKPGHHDAFINHQGVDTKRNVAGLLYYHLTCLRLRPFLDCFSMKLGDSLRQEIREAVLGCKAEKKVIPIFCYVKPWQLRIVDLNGRFHGCTNEEVRKFRLVLDDAAGIVGLSFDSSQGDWSALLKDTVDAIMDYI